VYCGGFTAQQVFHLLHGHRLAGTVELVPGCFLGGQGAAVEAVAAGTLAPEEFKFFSGAVTWAPGQLEREVADGAWCVALAALLRGVWPNGEGDAQRAMFPGH
jgi:putative AlgH/UPF0301 family transcriptional regulator